MKILYVAAEATPFIKTGGLADVAGSLPKALQRVNCDCRLVLPLYGQISQEYRSSMKKIAEFTVPMGWKQEYCGVLTGTWDGVTCYFLDNEAYFRRDSLYGQVDDGERFLFFSKAVTRLPRVIDFACDIIHANDWHSALVPVFVDDYRRGDAFYDPIRTVFTIHNLKYQGQFPLSLFYWTGLDSAYLSDYDLKFYDSMNFMKGGMVHANRITTVSPSYAEEIRYPFFAEGLEKVTQAYSHKLRGILNGIDVSYWNPETDPYLLSNFNGNSLAQKKANKRALQQAFGLPEEDHPLFAMVSRLTAMKGIDLIRYILEEFLQEEIQFVVLGTGESDYEEMFRYFAAKYPEKMACRLHYSEEESHRIYAASDFFVMPSISEPCGLSQMIAMRYGSLPIVREAGGLRDSVKPYNRYDHTGDGFSFQNINAHDLLFTMKRAARIYREKPEEYHALQLRAMEKDFSWRQSARTYREMYDSLLEERQS